MATTVGNWPLNKQYAQNEIAHRVVEVLQAEGRAAESGSTWSDWRAKVVPTLGQTWETVDRKAVREMGLGDRLGVLDWGKLFFGQEVSTFLRACSLRLQSFEANALRFRLLGPLQVKHTSDGIHPHPPGCWAYWNSDSFRQVLLAHLARV